MFDRNNPPGEAAQPASEAPTRHRLWRLPAANRPPLARQPSDFGHPDSKGPGVGREPDPGADKPAGGWSSQHPHAFRLSSYDIGLAESLSALPPGVLAAVFKTAPETFKSLPYKLDRVTIARTSG